MWRVLILTFLGMQCFACSGGISSYEEGVEAQSEIMQEMIGILEDVSDEASAEAAVGDIEALGKRLAELAVQFSQLPQPTTVEMQALVRKQRANQQEFQNKAFPQMTKLAQYESLSDAWTRAVTNLQ